LKTSRLHCPQLHHINQRLIIAIDSAVLSSKIGQKKSLGAKTRRNTGMEQVETGGVVCHKVRTRFLADGIDWPAAFMLK
jgi:hypothetical protein